MGQNGVEISTPPNSSSKEKKREKRKKKKKKKEKIACKQKRFMKLLKRIPGS